MECLPWSPSYSVGVMKIDEQHQRLVETINKLCSALNKGQENYILDDILNELAQYALHHFETEEEYFREFNYSKAEEHIAQHHEFRKKLLSLQEAKKEGKEMASSDTITFLGDWFANHVLKFDMDYVSCFHEHGLY